MGECVSDSLKVGHLEHRVFISLDLSAQVVSAEVALLFLRIVIITASSSLV